LHQTLEIEQSTVSRHSAAPDQLTPFQRRRLISAFTLKINKSQYSYRKVELISILYLKKKNHLKLAADPSFKFGAKRLNKKNSCLSVLVHKLAVHQASLLRLTA